MSNINFNRNQHSKQRLSSVQKGFLCIELLQGLLILGVLLLLVSAFHVLSVHWQHQAIKRLEALDLLATQLVGVPEVTGRSVTTGITVHKEVKRVYVPELSVFTGKPVAVDQKVVRATWQDERKAKHSIQLVS